MSSSNEAPAERPTASSRAKGEVVAGPSSYEIASDDLDELKAIYQSLLLAAGTAARGETPKGLFHLAQRLNFINVRTEKLLET